MPGKSEASINGAQNKTDIQQTKYLRRNASFFVEITTPQKRAPKGGSTYKGGGYQGSTVVAPQTVSRPEEADLAERAGRLAIQAGARACLRRDDRISEGIPGAPVVSALVW